MKLTKPGELRSFAAYPQCSADNRIMSVLQPLALPAKGLSIGCMAAGCLLVLACQSREPELPPVKTPLGVHLVCRPPQPSPWPAFPATTPAGWSCSGLRRVECDERRTLVVRVDERGNPTEAYIVGMRSPEVDACILAELRAKGWVFDPARECNGDPIAGEYTGDYEAEITCGHELSEATSGRTSGCS
jgi:hypothetical protein